MADVFMSAYMSGMFAMALVALKYYVVKMFENFNESMNGLGWADDP